jgi:hypothetical protein
MLPTLMGCRGPVAPAACDGPGPVPRAAGDGAGERRVVDPLVGDEPGLAAAVVPAGLAPLTALPADPVDVVGATPAELAAGAVACVPAPASGAVACVPAPVRGAAAPSRSRSARRDPHPDAVAASAQATSDPATRRRRAGGAR